MSKKSKKQPKKEPKEFDFSTFIKEQNLEVDDQVLELMETDKPIALNSNYGETKKSKNKRQPKQQEEVEDDQEDAEFDQELQLYNQMKIQESVQVVEYANQKEALIQQRQDFALNLDFIENLQVTVTRDDADVNDDLNRELSFYNQALKAAEIARNRFKELKIPFSRPGDYFAEMLKSDLHMQNVRKQLLEQNEQIKKSEEAKKQRQLKKFGKKVQVEKLLQRQQQKKEDLEKIKEIKKKGLNGDDFDVDLDLNTKPKSKVNHKRKSKDQKYGFGGSKRRAKSNTRNSTDDISGFSMAKMKKSAQKKGRVTKKSSR
jgi:rRNA-processing protein EBP2